MDLQNALLLIGAIIIAAVAISTYDKARLNRREQRKPRSNAGEFDPTIDNNNRTGQAPQPHLDINPGRPEDLGTRSLKPEASASEQARSQDSAFYRELESLEEAATTPLDLGPGTASKSKSSRRAKVIDLEGLFPAGQREGPNPKIDFIVHLPGPGPVIRDEALGIYRQNEYILEKPRQLYGLRYLVGLWSALERDTDDAQYSDLAAAIQMVDNEGPIDESELNTFLQLALKIADAFNRPTRLGMTVEQALVRARELVHVAEKYDVIATVNILADNNESFAGSAIDEAARHHGMRPGAMNIFHMKNKRSVGCRHLFSMANLYEPGEFDLKNLDTFRTSGLTLFMTIPCVYDPPRVFDKMVQTATSMSDMLRGRLADQDKRPLTEAGLSVIQQQIKQIATEITAEGIVPGSEAALRFFNQ
ncbi:MAG: cell division protein ZipA C-terminal FtsZ-binding domain-containing protein [Acidiferrobacterales bacterium]